MNHNVPPRTEASIWVYATDLDSGSGLYGLVAAAARSLGRPLHLDDVEIVAAVRIAHQLVVALGLAEPAEPVALPDGVEGAHLGGRHQGRA